MIKKLKDRSIPELLNIRVDDILKTARLPITTYILNTIISVSVNCKYYHNNYVATISYHYREMNVITYLKDKNGRISSIINDIKWGLVSKLIHKRTHTTKKTMAKFLH